MTETESTGYGTIYKTNRHEIRNQKRVEASNIAVALLNGHTTVFFVTD